MASYTYTINEFHVGLKVMIDGDPCVILENHLVKPGKGQAFNRVKYRNLKTGRVLERPFRASESLSAADVNEIEAQYLYNDGEFWHFMALDTYEQYAVSKTHVMETKKWLKEEIQCVLTMFNGAPLSITPPAFVELTITETDPGVRGDTATGGTKPATLETGAIVRVPLFINIGEIIRVDTRTGEYVSRAKG